MKRCYDYVLLDWDGNIARTLDVWLDACRTVLKKRGIHLADQEVARCFGNVQQQFSEWGVADTELAIAELHKIATQSMPQVALYPDAVAVLEKLRMGDVKTALVSSSRREHVVPVLDRYNLHHFFDVVLCEEDVTAHKPDKEPVERALAALGGTKDRAVVVGDSNKDLAAAQAAGVASVWFYPPEHHKFYQFTHGAAYNPTYTIDDFKQLVSIVFPPHLPALVRR